MTAAALAALDVALAEWVRALVALAAPGTTQRHEDDAQVIEAALLAPQRRLDDDALGGRQIFRREPLGPREALPACGKPVCPIPRGTRGE